jgi:hypothetical protein
MHARVWEWIKARGVTVWTQVYGLPSDVQATAVYGVERSQKNDVS